MHAMGLKKRSAQKLVCVVGLGYIGLPTALLLAGAGNTVIGFDTDTSKIERLQSGKLPFAEKGLSKLYAEVQKKQSFSCLTEMPVADVYIIAVPTPHTGRHADLRFVKSALRLIKPKFPKNGTIVVESTVGPRDCADILQPLIAGWRKPFAFAHCPERAIPGNTLHEMTHNDRIIGGNTPEDAQVVAQLYGTFVTGKIFLTNTTVAAACKVMENTYRAVNIALANEFARIAEDLHFDVWEAIALANKHPRVSIHQPGPGVGGHCIPIDPWFFATHDDEPSVITSGLLINESMPNRVAAQLKHALKKLRIQKPVIGVLGVAYKKNVDDTRESPAFPLIANLRQFAEVLITDPFVQNSKQLTITNLKQVLAQCNCVVLITDHDAYRECAFGKYPNIELIFDSRNLISQQQLEGFAGHVVRLGNGS